MSDDSLSNDELRTATVHGLRWTMVARPFSELAIVASMLLLARLVSPAEFGRFSVAAVCLALAAIPSGAISAALVQRRSLEREHVQGALSLTLIVGLLLSGMMMLVATLVIAPVFDARTATLVRLSLPTAFLTMAVTVPTAMLQRELQFKRIAIISVTSDVVQAAVGIALAVAGLESKALIFGYDAAAAATYALTVCWARTPAPRFRRRETRELLGYSGAYTLASISWVGFQNCDYAILDAKVSPLAAGLYFRAYSTGVKYQDKVGQVMSSVGFPVLARSRTDADMGELRATMSQLLALVLFPLLVLLAITAPTLVPWLYGARWAPAVVPTQILAIGGASTLLTNVVGAVFQAGGRKRALMGFGWGHFLCYATAVFLTCSHGIVAVAVAAAVVHTCFLLVAYLLLFPGRPLQALAALVRDTGAALLGCAALAAIALPISLSLRGHVPVVAYMAIVCGTGAVVYLAGIRIATPRSWRMLVKLASHLAPRGLPRLRGNRKIAPGPAV
jgi:lipopolysaccharide exporter